MSPSRHCAVASEADAYAVIEPERILFDGRRTQRMRVYLESHFGGVRLLSHDIGSGLAHMFGKELRGITCSADQSVLFTANGRDCGLPVWTKASSPIPWRLPSAIHGQDN
jgi:hypothetical protein